MKLFSIYLTNLRNDGHFQFFQFLIELVKSVGASVLKVEKQFAVIVALHAQEDEAFRKINKSSLTVRIYDADRARDKVFRSMVNVIRAGLTHFTPAAYEAATRLQIVMNVYGNVAKRSHIEATSAVYNLIHELTDKHAEDVKLLALGEWITELNVRNLAVQSLLEERADESAARTKLVLKEVRVKLDAAYRTFAEVVDAMTTMAYVNENAEEIAVYNAFVSRLNQRIDLLNKSTVQRRKPADKQK